MLWRSMQQVVDQDLAVHLYNAFALKRRDLDARTAQGLTMKLVSVQNLCRDQNCRCDLRLSPLGHVSDLNAIFEFTGQWTRSDLGTPQGMDRVAAARETGSAGRPLQGGGGRGRGVHAAPAGDEAA